MRSYRSACIRRLLAGALLVFGMAVQLNAGINLDVTRGPDDYQQSALGFDAGLTRRLSFDAGYSQFRSSGSVTANRNYSLGLGLVLDERFSVGMGFSVSPENEGVRSSGWNLSGSYDSRGKTFGWGASLDIGRTVYGEYTQYVSYRKRRSTTVTRWVNLAQGAFTPSLYCTLFGRLTTSAGITQYSYDRDLEAFSDRLTSLENANLLSGGMSALVSGFPDRTVFAGASLDLLDNLSLSFDVARTTYALDQPTEDSTTFGIAYSVAPPQLHQPLGHLSKLSADNN